MMVVILLLANQQSGKPGRPCPESLAGPPPAGLRAMPATAAHRSGAAHTARAALLSKLCSDLLSGRIVSSQGCFFKDFLDEKDFKESQEISDNVQPNEIEVMKRTLKESKLQTNIAA